MSPIIERLQKIEADVSADRGSFCLFALFLPEDALGKWDIVVAAPWIEKEPTEAVRYLSGLLQDAFSREEIVVFSRIAIVPCAAEEIDRLDNLHRVEHGLKEIPNQTLFGIRIATAYVITAMRHESDQVYK